MNWQLNLLLDDSLKLYQGNQLKKAINTVQIALEFGKKHPSELAGLASAYLLLAKIYNKKGFYQGDDSAFHKAIYFLEEARARFDELESPDLAAKFHTIAGWLRLNIQDTEASKLHFQEALSIASTQGCIKYMVQANMGLGQHCLIANDPASALEFAHEIERLIVRAAPEDHPKLKARMYELYSQAFTLMQAHAESLEMSQALLLLSRQVGKVEKEVIALRNIAAVWVAKGDYKTGTLQYLEALTKCEAIGYNKMAVLTQVNMGDLYAQLHSYDGAIKCYAAVLDQPTEVMDAKTSMMVFSSLGSVYLAKEEPDTAIAFLEKAIVLAEDMGSLECKASSYAQLGRAKIALGHWEHAKRDVELAQCIFTETNLADGLHINVLNLAKLAFAEKQYRVACDKALQAAELALSWEDELTRMSAYKLLASAFKAQGMFEEALKYQERYSAMQEESSKLLRSRHCLDMEIRYAIQEKQKEIELLTQAHASQSRLAPMADQITQQSEALECINDDLRQFAYIASHDLKEPLRTIGSFSQVIHKLAKPHLSESEQEFFKYVSQGVNRMNSLLDGLLRYSTISQSKEEATLLSLNDSMGQSMANLKIQILETSAIIEREELPTAKGTHQLFVQLFQNLLSNAIKFVKPGTQPHIKVRVLTTEDCHIVSITDNGIGIAPENHVKIFDIFKRLHHQSEYEGTGIGLAICQKIVKQLGGKIIVESTPGKGSTFSIKLPR